MGTRESRRDADTESKRRLGMSSLLLGNRRIGRNGERGSDGK
jgi:hypothetical protein